MSAENEEKRCENCQLGEKNPGGEVRLPNPIPSRIPLGFFVFPKIERLCLNFIDITFGKKERVVPIDAKCVKPKSFLPKE